MKEVFKSDSLFNNTSECSSEKTYSQNEILPKIIHIFGIHNIYLQMNRIKQILEEREITQALLARKLGKSYNMVNSYAQNRRQPSIQTLFKIADILEVEASELLAKNSELKRKQQKQELN